MVVFSQLTGTITIKAAVRRETPAKMDNCRRRLEVTNSIRGT